MSGALIYETQTLLMVGSAADVFSLIFRGAESAAITLGTDKYEDLPGILEALGTVSASGVAVSVVDNLGADVPTTDVFAADDVVTPPLSALPRACASTVLLASGLHWLLLWMRR